MKTDTARASSVPRALIIAAFAAIYLVWGSTYLGIRFAVETLPPFLMGGARFLIAGSLLYLGLRLRGAPAPDLHGWRNASIAAVFLLGIGNGAVNWAEQKVSSSLAALIIAGTPLWFATFEWLRPGGTRPTLHTTIGIVIGFAGVAVLVTSRNGGVDGGASLGGVVALITASMAWAGGSLYSKYSAKSNSAMMTAAQQMLAGGAILFVTGLVLGEARHFQWNQVSSRSLLAFVYLTLVGSLVGFTAYAWLLKVSTPARVSTYAYVNPVIAVVLGWALGGETLTGSMLVAATIIVGAVIVLTRRSGPAMKTGGMETAPASPATIGGPALSTSKPSNV